MKGPRAFALLPLGTDHRGSWALDGKPPSPPSAPGTAVRVEAAFDGPKVFTSLHVGPDDRYSTLDSGGKGSVRFSTPGLWRVDEVMIDGVIAAGVLAALEVEALSCTDRSVIVVHGYFGTGSRVSISATNVGDTAAYFYATWELEDVQ